MSEFDFVFLSYDEPNAEALYAELVNIVPWAKRVHGVKGFDSAHRACADAADTDFFVTVDGDNSIDEHFLNVKLNIGEGQEDHAWTWAGRNYINGLVYGTYSTSMINGSPYQAFRSGYREGVKMSLENGLRVSASEFSRKIWIYNLHKLLIWCSVGADVENGIWSIFGARQGVFDCNLTDSDHTMIRDYDWFKERWQSVKDLDPSAEAVALGDKLRQGLNIEIADLDANNSKFFKRIYINPPRPLVSYDNIKHLSAI